MTPIHIDLRTDLAKLTLDTIGEMGACHYTAPCAVGTMMTPDQRQALADESDNFDSCRIRELIDSGYVTVPDDEQSHDIQRLQDRFDRSAPDFWSLVEQLREKYHAG